MNILLRVLFAIVTFLLCAPCMRISTALASDTDKDKTQVSNPPLAVDLIYLGIASPVGFYGAEVVAAISENWGVDAGGGRGEYGNHITLNARRYISSVNGLSRYFLMGTSYSAGIAAERDNKDRDSDGQIGMKRQLGDALWVNAGFGSTYTTSWGLRYGFEFGLTSIIVDSISRKNKKSTEPDICDMFFCPRERTTRGIVLPAITPLRLGYAF